MEMSEWNGRKLARENEGLQGLISRNRKRCDATTRGVWPYLARVRVRFLGGLPHVRLVCDHGDDGDGDNDDTSDGPRLDSAIPEEFTITDYDGEA